MDYFREYRFQLFNIIEACEKITLYCYGFSSWEDLIINDDEKNYNAIRMNLIILSKNASALPKEVKQNFPSINWHFLEEELNALSIVEFNYESNVIFTFIQTEPPLIQETILRKQKYFS